MKQTSLSHHAVKAAALRQLEASLRVEADGCRTRADQADGIAAPLGSVLGDYQRDVARHWRQMADSAEFHADEAAARAGDYEQHPLAGVA